MIFSLPRGYPVDDERGPPPLAARPCPAATPAPTYTVPRDLYPRRLAHAHAPLRSLCDDGSTRHINTSSASHPPPLPSLLLPTPPVIVFCALSLSSSLVCAPTGPCLDRSTISPSRPWEDLSRPCCLTSARPCLTLPHPACRSPFDLKADKLPSICCSDSRASHTHVLSSHLS